MEEPKRAPRPSALSSFIILVQTIVFILFAIVTLMALTELRKADVPGAPVQLLWVTIGVFAMLALVHLPPVFKRLPRFGGWVAYAAIIPAIILFSNYNDQMAPVWERTPKGIKEVAERAKQAEIDAVRDAEQAKRDADDRRIAEAEAAGDRLRETKDKLEACFSTFGHRLSALEDTVKSSLHNPDAFEHVETVLVDPDYYQNNVEMTFRAENGFGALRVGRVRAQMNADDCSVENIGKPEVD